MGDFFSRLFSAKGFIPRSTCGEWSTEMALAYQVGDLLIAFCYFSIPITLLILYRNHRKDFQRSWVILLFAAFVILCGLTHVCQALTFYWPAYRLFVVVTWVAAVVSIVAAFVLPFAVDDIVKAADRIRRENSLVPTERQSLEVKYMVEHELRMKVETELASELIRSAGYKEALDKARRGMVERREGETKKAEDALSEMKSGESGILKGETPGG